MTGTHNNFILNLVYIKIQDKTFNGAQNGIHPVWQEIAPFVFLGA